MLEMILGEALIIGTALAGFERPLWFFIGCAGLITEGFIRFYKNITTNN